LVNPLAFVVTHPPLLINPTYFRPPHKHKKSLGEFIDLLGPSCVALYAACDLITFFFDSIIKNWNTLAHPHFEHISKCEVSWNGESVVVYTNVLLLCMWKMVC
jgi:hypothetical protein